MAESDLGIGRFQGRKAAVSGTFKTPRRRVTSGEACVVAFQHGARWPGFLAAELSGESDAVVVCQYADEELGAFISRLIDRMDRCERSVRSLVWLLAQESLPEAEYTISRVASGVDHLVAEGVRFMGAPSYRAPLGTVLSEQEDALKGVRRAQRHPVRGAVTRVGCPSQDGTGHADAERPETEHFRCA